MAQLHGLRHGKLIHWNAFDFKADTKTDDSWVMLLHNGTPFARQAKQSTGKRFRQGGTNPDYTGHDAYPLEYYDEKWRRYDDAAHKGEIRYELARLVQAANLS